ncbi:50S ribosomal protein L21 [Mycoplasma bradburyae]|uniref:Large ribosomal subunit protein bL21 n=1 Tax=Mycoplasma bradburyae TaxID=2963128 RepID=A0AAW6HS74_9MOLU|nr:50S ribosomal protein L21 [Mycoplasma bradburyae]MDC4163674.1 50S ribosomal protein L21 [Mycoplasma bradburyae]MDC4182282.1 50S ribosomal protein L21 [Mycoplasma bradburyae]MDC4182775.1 50S ribosomal protein L21 [Mycoplasma bradburyae]MDC4183448.1 50S ribosomal protein L21 [Mycoplasma bradburyae]MDC4184456.1 50S ribosomal protein L21 [Mycoplasma bradburyae]
MFAVIASGSKQYRVKLNDEIYVEKINSEVGAKVVFDKVYFVNGLFGKPFVAGASVVCEVVKQGKQKKINVIKHISQKHHLKKYGHRQPYTKLKVVEIKHG